MAPATPFRIGTDAQSDTGEAHARPTADPTCVQPLTYPFFLEWVPGYENPIQQPPNYTTELGDGALTFGLTANYTDELTINSPGST